MPKFQVSPSFEMSFKNETKREKLIAIFKLHVLRAINSQEEADFEVTALQTDQLEQNYYFDAQKGLRFIGGSLTYNCHLREGVTMTEGLRKALTDVASFERRYLRKSPDELWSNEFYQEATVSRNARRVINFPPHYLGRG